jgi:TPR repeat protein
MERMSSKAGQMQWAQFDHNHNHINNKSHEVEVNITTREDLKFLLPDGAFNNPFESVEVIVLNAIQNRYFPVERAIVLRKMVFSLPPNIMVTIPANVTLYDCEVTCGQINFSQGQLFATTSNAVAYAIGLGASSHATAANAVACSISGANAYAAAPEARAYSYANSKAYAVVHFAQAMAMEDSAEAIATVIGAIADKSSANAITKNFVQFQAEIAEEAYQLGKNHVKSGDKEAITFLKKAVEAGHPKAAYRLGRLFLANKDNANAIIYLKIASDNDNAFASYDLGQKYYDSKDTDSAIFYLKKAADAGLSKAAYLLSTVLLGTDEDADGISYLIMAADNDHTEASYQLGMRYFKGNKVKQSDSKTVLYLTRAHEERHSDAAFQLGESYMARRLLRYDPATAKKWYQIAVDIYRHKEAQQRLDQMNASFF